jgi:hypothetical protein
MFKKWIPIQYSEDVNGVKRQIKGTGKFDDDFIHQGSFHQWGVNYEDFDDSGIGNYTTAIIETPFGIIEEVLPCNFRFLD